MTRADWLVLLLAIALLPVLYTKYWGAGGPADRARIAANGQAPLEIPLSRNQQLHIHGPLGDSVLEVKDGRARFLSSPCPGQQCVHSGWLARAGDLAACLPNGITLSLQGARPRFDSINF